MKDAAKPVVCTGNNAIDYTFCVVYPKNIFSSPDEKAKELSHMMHEHYIDHHILGLYSSPELPIEESMIVVYNVICDKYLIFNNYDEFSKAYDEMCCTTHIKEYGILLSDIYVRVQNAYLSTMNSTEELPCKVNKQKLADKLHDLLLDIRLRQAYKYKTALIEEYNKGQYGYDDELMSEEEYAKSEGFYIDDDGNWVPDDEDDLNF